MNIFLKIGLGLMIFLITAIIGIVLFIQNISCTTRKSCNSFCYSVASTFGYVKEKTNSSTVQTTHNPIININNTVGSITITTHNDNTCIIKSTIVGPTDESLKTVYVKKECNSESINLKTVYPSNNGKAYVNYELTVPYGSKLNLYTTTGSIEGTNIQDSIKASTTTGSININCTRILPKSHINLEATTGSITLTVPPLLNANVKAGTTIGSLHSDFKQLTKETEFLMGGTMHGSIKTIENSVPPATITIETTTGSVSLLNNP